MDDKKQLVMEMRRYSLAKYNPNEPFTLASGKESPWYFDVKSALMYDITRYIIARMLNDKLCTFLKTPPMPFVGGPANAAYLLVPLISFIPKFFVYRKAEKGYGIVGRIDGWGVEEGDKVILVEDVITTGGSLLPCIKYVEGQGGILESIIPVIDRNEDDKLGEYRSLVNPLTVKEDFQHWSDSEEE